ncbi:ABC transporter G family member 23-like [Nilaparvata lugens]|uniref:ABC transporter G family member 23-like n=1 Tax=Nilaparvata lugens TaxID=108931 RepID=UPI00193DA800|nr:ABC transporter G family member 23-like [Nilaparvata lugens]
MTELEGGREDRSGGQQRRVSMAVALFHNPKFLILDEPTVGLDPLLCESIWKYFIEITNVDHKTIIITTHYIEEARNAHTIGLMRSGILLAETSPLQLMEMNNCSSLEEAFLTLSQKQEDIPSDDTYPPATKQADIFEPGAKWHGIDSLLKFTKTSHGLGEIYRKEGPAVFMITAFMILLPFLLFTIFLGMLGKDEMDVTIAAVQDEVTPGTDDCNNSRPIRSIYGCVAQKRLSCEFISFLKEKSYTILMYDSLDEGITAVKRNKAWALLYFHKNYTESLLERIDRGKKASNMSLANSLLEVYPDNSIYYIAQKLRWDLHSGFMSFMENFLRNCEIDDRVVKSPITEGEEIYESIAVRYIGLNGYIIAILYYLAMVYTSSSMVYEKSKGLFERTMVTDPTLSTPSTSNPTMDDVNMPREREPESISSIVLDPQGLHHLSSTQVEATDAPLNTVVADINVEGGKEEPADPASQESESHLAKQSMLSGTKIDPLTKSVEVFTLPPPPQSLSEAIDLFPTRQSVLVDITHVNFRNRQQRTMNKEMSGSQRLVVIRR